MLNRATYFKDWSGKYSVWNTRTGVCFDFANIYAIMCRQQGIACTTIGAKSLNHMWNLVQINGRWTELDISLMAKYKTYKQDTTIRTGSKLNLGKAFNTIATSYDTSKTKDLEVNRQLMYGNPDSRADDVHYLG